MDGRWLRIDFGQGIVISMQHYNIYDSEPALRIDPQLTGEGDGGKRFPFINECCHILFINLFNHPFHFHFSFR